MGIFMTICALKKTQTIKVADEEEVVHWRKETGFSVHRVSHFTGHKICKFLIAIIHSPLIYFTIIYQLSSIRQSNTQRCNYTFVIANTEERKSISKH